MRFQGSERYVATPDLMLAVNAALTLKRPLLVKGEPGTGKTMLAEEVAQALGMPLLQWHVKSTTKAQQGLYEYDAVSRLRDSQLPDADSAAKVRDIRNYIVQGVLWQAFTADQPVALLIDEIDKADIEFPNDLLRELDRMEFYVYETRELVKAHHRPVVLAAHETAPWRGAAHRHHCLRQARRQRVGLRRRSGHCVFVRRSGRARWRNLRHAGAQTDQLVDG